MYTQSVAQPVNLNQLHETILIVCAAMLADTRILSTLAAAGYTVQPGTVKGRVLPLIVGKAVR